MAFGRKRSRNDWTPEENSAFLEGIRMSASLDSMAARARAIAAGVGSRTENQCMQVRPPSPPLSPLLSLSLSPHLFWENACFVKIPKLAPQSEQEH